MIKEGPASQMSFSVDEILKADPATLSVLALREAAALAAAAYSDTPPVVEGFKTIKFDSANAQGFALVSPDTLFFVPRGTDSKFDILRDADARLIDDRWGKIHSGFHAQYLDNGRQIFNIIRNSDPKTKIYWVSHSLGSALSCLGIADVFRELGRNVTGAILFGTPKIGNKEYVKSWDAKFAARTWCVINGSDGVPLGPRYFTMANVGRIVRINSANQIVLTPQTLSQRIRERIVDRILHGSGGSAQAISDHLMVNTIASLNACCPHSKPL